MCFVLNLIFLVLLGWELNNNYAVLEVKGITKKTKRNCIIRIVTACGLEFIALLLLYNLFGITTYNLSDYIRYGKV